MPSSWFSAAAFVVVTSLTISAHAQCTKDTECKGDRVCDAGRCAGPPPPASTAPPAVAPAPARPPDAVEPASSAPEVTVETTSAPRPAVTPDPTDVGDAPIFGPSRRKKKLMRGLGAGLFVTGGVSVLTLYILGQAGVSLPSESGQRLGVLIGAVSGAFVAGLLGVIAGALMLDHANDSNFASAAPKPPAPPHAVRFVGLDVGETPTRTLYPVLKFQF